MNAAPGNKGADPESAPTAQGGRADRMSAEAAGGGAWRAEAGS